MKEREIVPTSARGVRERRPGAPVDAFAALIRLEVAGISALDAAIAAETRPDYVVLFRDTKSGKQSNVEQLATHIRLAGQTPDEAAWFRQLLQKTQTRIAEAIGGTQAALRSLRAGTRELHDRYTAELPNHHGVARATLEKAHGRITVHLHVLRAHLARLGADDPDAIPLPWPLGEYFAGPNAKACMRCHLDRPGAARSLERTDPHPYTYVCAGCHDDVLAEFKPDVAEQIGRWTEQARESRVIQHALGRTSKLMAQHTVLRRLSGLPENPPVPAPRKPLQPPLPPPSPDPAAPRGVVQIDAPSDGDADYVATLFDPRLVRQRW